MSRIYCKTTRGGVWEQAQMKQARGGLTEVGGGVGFLTLHSCLPLDIAIKLLPLKTSVSIILMEQSGPLNY